ncbi:MAG: glycosyltransferase family 39 protein [Planctomycetes bacterium]|nr:glycosyltransferase family 39 protein [Planctomycetota bacterium]
MPVDQSASVETPRGILAWLPYLWSRVLFPGQADPDRRVRPLSLLLLIILPGLLLYPTRSFHLLEPDEGRYAQIAREMHDRNEWIVPTLQGQPYLDKPPLLYWLVRLSYSWFGVSETSARLFPALAVHGAILIVYLIGRRSLGERSALWGALLLTIAPGFMGMGRMLLLDGLLTFFVTLSLFAGFEAIRGERFRRGWWLVAAVACGLGILTKGPISILLLAPPLWLFRWLTGSQVRIGWKNLAMFLLVAFLVNLPWYTGIYLRTPIFLRYFFWEHNILRFVQPFDHLQPVWYFLPIALGGLLPGTLLLWGLGKHLASGDPDIAARRSFALGFWLIAGLWCLFFFSLSGSKLPTYILPAFPCLTLALGDFIAHSKWNRSNWTRAGVGVMACLLVFAHYHAVPWYAEQRSPMANREKMTALCANPQETVICFPRNVDSVAFYLGRDDLRNVRTKYAQTLIDDLLTRHRTVVLFTHRHSLQTFKDLLPPGLRITETFSLRRDGKHNSLAEKLAGDSPWGLCDVAVIERAW